MYSCHAYEKYKHTADINIIQMTGPHRMTYYTPLLDPFHLPLGQVTNNYNKITDQKWFNEHFVFKTHMLVMKKLQIATLGMIIGYLLCKNIIKLSHTHIV